MKYYTKHNILISCLLIGHTTVTQAAVLAEYNFNGGSVASSDSSINSIAADATFTNVVFPATLEDDVFRRDFLDESYPTYEVNSFVEFSTEITGLNVGQTINLTSFTFDYTQEELFAFPGSVDTLWKVGLFSNLSAAGLDPSSTPVFEETGAGAVFPDLSNTFNTTGAEYKGLENGDVVTFRIYFAGGGNGSTTRVHIIDNVRLSGDVAVIPEPSSFALIGLGMAGLLFRRRR